MSWRSGAARPLSERKPKAMSLPRLAQTLVRTTAIPAVANVYLKMADHLYGRASFVPLRCLGRR